MNKIAARGGSSEVSIKSLFSIVRSNRITVSNYEYEVVEIKNTYENCGTICPCSEQEVMESETIITRAVFANSSHITDLASVLLRD